MMCNWKMLGLLTILATVLAAAPPAAAQTDGPAEPDKVDVVLSQLKGVTKALAELEKKVTEALDNFEKNNNLKLSTVQADIKTLKDQCAQLRQDLDALRTRLPAGQSSTSLYPPAAAAAGRVRLVNTYPTPMSIVVNNRSYQVPPGQDAYTDPMPAGTFTYEVLGVQPRVLRSLSPGETFTITVHPR